MNGIAKVTNGNITFELKIKGIRGNIMKLESTGKTKAYGVPEYLTLIFNGSKIRTFASNGWKVTLTK